MDAKDSKSMEQRRSGDLDCGESHDGQKERNDARHEFSADQMEVLLDDARIRSKLSDCGDSSI